MLNTWIWVHIGHVYARCRAFFFSEGQELARNSQGDSWERVSQIRDKFEYDRERRMREKAFAPMTGGMAPGSHQSVSRNQRFDAQRYFSQSESE
uniref:Uncharacterized protein n=1 Tax=Vitis vinifera TaxID=29760 RepID=F6I782_VITVI